MSEIVAFSRAERSQVTSWSTPPGWDAEADPPGRGKFLLKNGQRPGIPVHVDLTAAERAAQVHNRPQLRALRATGSATPDPG